MRFVGEGSGWRVGDGDPRVVPFTAEYICCTRATFICVGAAAGDGVRVNCSFSSEGDGRYFGFLPERVAVMIGEEDADGGDCREEDMALTEMS